MGNRAVIATERQDVGIYLHWNGGRDSVGPLLAACKGLGWKSPEKDAASWEKLAAMSDVFGGGQKPEPLNTLDCDNGDNGVYVIEDWEIIRRKHHSGPEQNHHDAKRITEHIMEAYEKTLKAKYPPEYDYEVKENADGSEDVVARTPKSPVTFILDRADCKSMSDGYHLDVWTEIMQTLGLEREDVDAIEVKFVGKG